VLSTIRLPGSPSFGLIGVAGPVQAEPPGQAEPYCTPSTDWLITSWFDPPPWATLS